MNAAARRSPHRRLRDVVDAIAAIESHLSRGDLRDGLIYDAVRMRTLEIGEAIKDVPADVLATEPGIPWRELRGTRDRLAHRYFLDDVAYLRATVIKDLGDVEAAVRRMLERVDRERARQPPVAAPSDEPPPGGV